MNIAEGSAAERLPFVGEDGLMPAVSRPQPGRLSRLAYVRSFTDYEYLADRNDGARCAGILATCCGNLVHTKRWHGPAVS